MADQQSNDLKGELLSIQRDFPENEDDDDKLTLLFECNEKIYKVMLMRQTLPGFDTGSDSIEQSFLERLDECNSWDGGPDDEPEGLEEKSTQLYMEIEDLTRLLLQPIFSDRAPTIDSSQNHTSLPKNLEAYMNPEAFTFQFVTKSGKPALIPRDDLPPPCFHPPISDLVQISPNTPRLPSSSIKVLEQLGPSWVLKVVVNGQIMCCKITNQALHESLSKEYSALQQIAEKSGRSTRSTRLLVPSLKGVVESKKGQVVGILMEFIPAISNLADILTSDSNNNPVEMTRKSKWALQIEHTLRSLHAADVVWEDAKTSNILIDDKDDAWIVDFGGGQTWGWVDTELVGTKDGDMQALQKIRQALQV